MAWPHAGWVTPLAELLSAPILVTAAGHKASLCRAAPRRHPTPARSHPTAAPLHGGSSSPPAPPTPAAGSRSSDGGEGDRTPGPGMGHGCPPQPEMGQGAPGQGWGMAPPTADEAREPQPGSSPSSDAHGGSALEKLSPPEPTNAPEPPNPPSRAHGTRHPVL